MLKKTVPIKGMHCRSCEITLTDKLESLYSVKKAEVSLRKKTATVYADRLPHSSDIEKAVLQAGYEIGTDKKPLLSKNVDDYFNILFGIAVIVGLGVLFKYFNLSSLTSFGTSGQTGGTMALLVGLTAGFSTCMALVGGLVLGLSAKHAEKHPDATRAQRFRPHLFFNLSRIISFAILGGVIGGLGSFISLQGPVLGALTIFVGLVMMVLGLQLTEIFPRLSGGGLTLPSGISKALGLKDHREKEYSHKNAMMLGGLSFFLPCGFTQAMQLYAISTGSFSEGALVMGLFAIGTAPGLLGIGGLTSIVKGAFAKRFFKVVGVTVIAMALYNIGNGYNLTGWPKFFEQAPETSRGQAFSKPIPKLYEQNEQDTKVAQLNASKDHTLRAVYYLNSDIFPNKFAVNANEEYTLEVDTKEDGQGCMSTIMIPGLVDKPQFLTGGEKNILKFTATRPGTYKITCAMGVPRGTITVV